jgi:Spy/CpxP family protein refolding chaperone
MRAKILSIVLLMCLSAALVAQTTENSRKNANRGPQKEMRMDNEQRGPGSGLNLTDPQKEAFKQNMMAMHKQVLPLRGELGEVEAHQKTLVTAEKPDLAAINKNIEKIGAIRVEMAKIEVKHRLDMRAQLTDEQRLKFDLMKGKMRQDKGAKGMRHNMRM